MRIVLASRSSLPYSVGGGETHLLGLAHALQELGHQPLILTVEKVGTDCVSLRRDHSAGLPFYYLTVPDCRSKYYRSPLLTTWARKWMKEQQVEIVHLFLFSHLLGLIPAATELGIPVCLTALEFSYFCRRYDMLYQGHELCQVTGRRGAVCESCELTNYSNKQQSLARAMRLLPPVIEDGLRKMVMRVSGQDRLIALGQRAVTREIEAQRASFDQEIAAVITPSSVMRQFFAANGVPGHKLHLIPYGTEVKGKPNGASKADSGGLRVGYIGRLDPKKGIHTLCEAVSLLPSDLSISVKIYGPPNSAAPEYLSRIRKFVETDRRLQLSGQLNREELPAVYNELDVLVVPSLWYENSPITITEALAFGCPVVCSATPGMADLIQSEVNGLTFPMGDSQALASCLHRLVEEPGLLSRLRSQIQPVESTQDVALQIVRLYTTLLAERVTEAR